MIQNDIPLTSHPFRELADCGNLSPDEILAITKNLFRHKVIRRFGAILRHQNAGFTKNALIVWSVPKDKLETISLRIASFSFISHCYERNPAFLEKYNVFTMLHARPTESITAITKELAATMEISDYLILESVQEYKKISPEYF